MADRLAGPILDGQVAPYDIGQQAWASYASSVWGGIELRDLRRKWDSAPADQSAIMSQAAAFLAKGKQDMADKMLQRLTALRGGAESCLNVLQALIRDNSTTGPVHGMAYNAGMQRSEEHKSEIKSLMHTTYSSVTLPICHLLTYPSPHQRLSDR